MAIGTEKLFVRKTRNRAVRSTAAAATRIVNSTPRLVNRSKDVITAPVADPMRFQV